MEVGSLRCVATPVIFDRCWIQLGASNLTWHERCSSESRPARCNAHDALKAKPSPLILPDGPKYSVIRKSS